MWSYFICGDWSRISGNSNEEIHFHETASESQCILNAFRLKRVMSLSVGKDYSTVSI